MFDGLRIRLERRLAKLTGATASPSMPSIEADLAAIEGLRNKGNEYIAAGELDRAESCFRSALSHAPDSTQLLVCLGYVLKEQGRLVEGRVALRKAAHRTGTHPAVFEAYYLLGQISEAQGDTEDARRQFSAALEHKPDFVPACVDSLRMLMTTGKKSEVPEFLQACIQRCPSEPEYRLILGRFWNDVGNFQGVVDNFTAAMDLGAPPAELDLPMGHSLLKLYREEESRHYLDRAMSANPALAPFIDTVRGVYFGHLGDEAKAIGLLQRVLAAGSNYVIAHSALLMILSYSKLDKQRKDYVAAAKRFASVVEAGFGLGHTMNDRNMEVASSRPLRVGFVAGEFKNHPVLHFLLGLLENLDESRIQTVAFSNNVYDDSGTKILKGVFDEWVEIRDVDDQAAAALVRGKNIDVLLDLCGHSGDGRLAMFAQKPAPVQATWLGYWASTGLSAMDYILVDPACISVEAPEWFSEEIYCLPHTRLCMTAPRSEQAILVAPAPCSRKGYVTFGSFQRTAKLNDDVLTLWARVLSAVPSARLRIQTDTVRIEDLRRLLITRMQSAGLDLSRVDVLPQGSAAEYLAAYSEVDMILDTFPFTGGTTTAQALWMGVPTVTRMGETMLSMQGVSMLRCVGLTDWIARNDAHYIEIACKFASDHAGLEQLRAELRERALQSPLFDTKRFSQDFTDALWDIYRAKQIRLQNTSE